jgi:hypothetical protein
MEILILLAVLACPIVMGTMMVFMWRGMRAQREESAPQAAPEHQLTTDRQEVARR